MMAFFPRRVGILGGGQLARMLAQGAFSLGLGPLVLAEDFSDPAAQVSPGAIFGSWENSTSLRRFLSKIDLAIYENEFLPCDRLKIAGSGLSVRFIPGIQTLYLLQDKLRQKEILLRLEIPFAPYWKMPKDSEPVRWCLELRESLGHDLVLKWAKLGYDGKGTLILVGDASDHQKSISSFVKKALALGVDVFAEKKIGFKRELAILGVYSTQGEFKHYPLVISEQENGICKRVRGPAVLLGVDPKLEKLAMEYAEKLARELSSEEPFGGVFAMEFFETEKGELLVNEIAPRVHNTGHYSIDASQTSQFENHWRGVLGMPLGACSSQGVFAMLNLLGVDKKVQGLPNPTSRLHLHWYGKSEMRSGRKMGHLTAVGESESDMPGLMMELENCEKLWLGG